MSHPATSKNKIMRCISTLLISLLLAVPAMSVELFRYSGIEPHKRRRYVGIGFLDYW